MRKKKKIGMALLLTAVLAVTGCDAPRTDPEENTQAQPERAAAATEEAVGGMSDEIAALAEEEPETLEFVDARGEWHVTEIVDAVEKHSFDWSRLSGSELTLSYEDERYTTRIGIDVSQYQGTIDWQAVRESGVTFAFIRIGGRGYGEAGILYADDMALTNLAGAREAGLDVGVYFFAQAVSEEEAVEEAEFVLALLDGVPLELPVVYDPESILDDVARTDDVSGEQFTKNTLAFCDRIREAGYAPMVYCNMLWQAYELDLVALQEADLPLWYADYEALPQTPYAFSFWQYAEDAYVNGVEGQVDLNLQFFSASAHS